MKKLRSTLIALFVFLLMSPSLLAGISSAPVKEEAVRIPIIFLAIANKLLVQKVVNNKFGFEECEASDEGALLVPTVCTTVYPAIVNLGDEYLFNRKFTEVFDQNARDEFSDRDTIREAFVAAAFMGIALGVSNVVVKRKVTVFGAVSILSGVVAEVLGYFVFKKSLSLEESVGNFNKDLTNDQVEEVSRLLYNIIIKSIRGTGESLVPMA